MHWQLQGIPTPSSSKRSTSFSNTNAVVCIIVDGITLANYKMEEKIVAKTKNVLINNLGFEERKVNEELDKFHRLGKAKGRKQPTVVRFKSHPFRASAYVNSGTIQHKKKLKVKLSLTRRRTKIINYAHTITEPVPEVKLAYADVLILEFVYMNKEKVNIRFHLPELKAYMTFSENSAGLYQIVIYLMIKMFS